MKGPYGDQTCISGYQTWMDGILVDQYRLCKLWRFSEPPSSISFLITIEGEYFEIKDVDKLKPYLAVADSKDKAAEIATAVIRWAQGRTFDREILAEKECRVVELPGGGFRARVGESTIWFDIGGKITKSLINIQHGYQ